MSQSQKPLLDKPYSILPRLKTISISKNKTFITASTEDTLVIYLLPGKKVDSKDIKGIVSTAKYKKNLLSIDFTVLIKILFFIVQTSRKVLVAQCSLEFHQCFHHLK